MSLPVFTNKEKLAHFTYTKLQNGTSCYPTLLGPRSLLRPCTAHTTPFSLLYNKINIKSQLQRLLISFNVCVWNSSLSSSMLWLCWVLLAAEKFGFKPVLSKTPYEKTLHNFLNFEEFNRWIRNVCCVYSKKMAILRKIIFNCSMIW